MIELLRTEVAGLLPMMIREAEFADPSLILTGEDWSFTAMCALACDTIWASRLRLEPPGRRGSDLGTLRTIDHIRGPTVDADARGPGVRTVARWLA